MKKLWVKAKGADNMIHEFVFNTNKPSTLTNLMIEKGLQDYFILDWKLVDITFFE